MVFVLYRPDVKLFNAMSFQDDWTDDIRQAILFRSEKAAIQALRSRLNKWKYYVETWTGHEHYPKAVETFGMWETAEVRRGTILLDPM